MSMLFYDDFLLFTDIFGSIGYSGWDLGRKTEVIVVYYDSNTSVRIRGG